ncbi:MAG: hypothetical protein JWP11_1285 [Frankiales bacterium]|nr:hypothetical protein [Frankiales bacterium]
MSLLTDLDTRGLALQQLDEAMGQVVDGKVVGRHHFAVYSGDIVLGLDPRTGLQVPQNPLVYETPVVTNLIVDVGKQAYLDRLGGMPIGSPIVAFAAIGVGTDSTAAAAGQTKLNPTVTGSVLLQTVDATYPSRSAFVATWKSTFGTAVANFTWNEAGIFNGTVNGTSTMFNRVIIGPFAKTSAVSIAYTTTITQS